MTATMLNEKRGFMLSLHRRWKELMLVLILGAVCFSIQQGSDCTSEKKDCSGMGETVPSRKFLQFDHILSGFSGRKGKTSVDQQFPRAGTQTFEDFIDELKQELDSHMHNDDDLRALDRIMNLNKAGPKPDCSGLWMEFGVYKGFSISMAANWKKAVCGDSAAPVYGFDTFTGLPEPWVPNEKGVVMEKHAFSLGGEFPEVPDNVQLVKGLFNESLPGFLENIDASGGPKEMVTYLNIDCDLYAGTRDAFTILADRIAPGCILVFDELINYPLYRDHEVKALWEYLQASGRKLVTVGIQGPLPGRDYIMEVDPTVDEPWQHQSAAFIIV